MGRLVRHVVPQNSRPLRWLGRVALVVVLSAAPSSVLAQTSSSGAPPHLAVSSPAVPGEETALSSLIVTNEGEAALRYSMSAHHGEGAPADVTGWIHFDPSEFTLDPGAVAEVVVSAVVPSGEPEGTHQVLLLASASPSDGAVGVPAPGEVLVEFTVGSTRGEGLPPAIYGLAVVMAVVAGAIGYRVAALSEGWALQSPVRRRPSFPPDSESQSASEVPEPVVPANTPANEAADAPREVE